MFKTNDGCRTNMEYLIRFIQMHESFRQAEINALAEFHGLRIRWISYTEDSPFGLLAFEGIDNKNADVDAAARVLTSRSILCYGIYEVWGYGEDYPALHRDIVERTQHRWPQYREASFKFELDSFHGSRSPTEQREIIESFSYMDFVGPIVMNNPDTHFTVLEESALNGDKPHRLFLGRLVGSSGRKATVKYNLKKRRYISTTSMDAELSLVTANLAWAGPGRLAYDPFMGTGSFPLACAHFGSTVFGSDMDGRSIRGKKGRNVAANFAQYETTSLYLDGFAADLTNTPLWRRRFLDAIVCDPPYGVREGLKVLGSDKPELQREVVLSDGRIAHVQSDYVPPRKPYSFFRMMDDILQFGSESLNDGGRLCMWMPVAGTAVAGVATSTIEVEEAYAVPLHPALEVVSVCQQNFNKWSRRLLTYRRKADEEVDAVAMVAYQAQRLGVQQSSTTVAGHKTTADELNSFRRQYFQGFKDPDESGTGAEASPATATNPTPAHAATGS